MPLAAAGDHRAAVVNAGSQLQAVCPGVPGADTDVPVVHVIFAPARPYGVHLEASSCNGRSAFATYEPGPEGRVVVSGLQVLRLAGINGESLITALESYRDPEIAIRCGMRAVPQ